MMDDLIFASKQLNEFNYTEILKSSLDTFYSSDKTKSTLFISRYRNTSGYKKIHYCSVSNKTELVSSCLLVEGVLMIADVSYPVYFLTQVITAEKYRANGYSRILLERVEQLAASMGRSMIIVIARKSVGDFYSKFGFKGFSHFPEFTRVSSKHTIASKEYRVATQQDLELLNMIYSKNVKYSHGKLWRNFEDWKQITRLQSKSTYEVFLPVEKNLQCYVIAAGKTIYEVATTETSKRIEHFLGNMFNDFDKIEICNCSPVAAFLSKSQWKYNERFEPREGHLIKAIAQIPLELESFIDDATNRNGARRLSIDLVDQW